MTEESKKCYITWVPSFIIDYAARKRRNFYSLELDYDRAHIEMPFVVFLGILIFCYMLMSLFYFFFALFLFSYGFRNFSFIDLFFALAFFFLVSPLSFLALYNYPRVRAFLLKIRLDPEIKKVAKFFLEELDKGDTAYHIFEKLADSDLKAARKEFRFIMHLVEKERKKLIEALMICASQTSSDKFREFLYNLNLTLRNEKELRRVLKTYLNK